MIDIYVMKVTTPKKKKTNPNIYYSNNTLTGLTFGIDTILQLYTKMHVYCAWDLCRDRVKEKEGRKRHV